MAMRRVTETFLSAFDAMKLLRIASSSNLHAVIRRRTTVERREVQVLIDNGQVVAQEVIVGRRRLWLYSRAFVERVASSRAADRPARARDQARSVKLRERTGHAEVVQKP